MPTVTDPNQTVLDRYATGASLVRMHDSVVVANNSASNNGGGG